MVSSKIYDLGIIGAGVAGAFASFRIANNFPSINAAVFELGRPPGKRRRQLEGWLGCFPMSDAKLHLNDKDQINCFSDGRKTRHIISWVFSILEDVGSLKEIKDKQISNSLVKKIENLNFKIKYNNYVQWKPESIHKLSKVISDATEEKNIDFYFDNEVFQILKQDGAFKIITQDGDFLCKKIVLCTGRSGWRWANKLYKDLGINVKDNIAKVGVKFELPAQYMKEFNKSHCTLIRDDLEIGPFCWNGTVIPEDHADLVLASFRANEDRWKSDKVSFSMIYKFKTKESGVKETERLAKLAFLLYNDRVGRDKVKSIIKNEYALSPLKEYDFLADKVKEIEPIVPQIVNRGYFHSPAIIADSGEINLSSDLESDVEGMFVAGENAGFYGIIAAAISGTLAVDAALKG